MLDKLTCDDFARYVGESFTVALDDGEETLSLIEAKPLGAGRRDGGAFSLLFRGPPEPHLAQATYRMVCRELGTLELFLVPIAPDADGPLYEAVFT